MRCIPLHLQRRFEQRWATRFASPAASTVPKSVIAKAATSLRTISKKTDVALEGSKPLLSEHVPA